MEIRALQQRWSINNSCPSLFVNVKKTHNRGSFMSLFLQTRPHLLLFSQLPSSSFTPPPSRTQTHLLILSFRFPRRPPPSPRPAVSRPLWLPPQTSLPAPQDVWRRTVFLTTSTFKAPDGLRWGWHFPTERRAREAHTHPLPTPTALLSSERNAALVDTRDQGDVKGQERGADPPEAPAQ